MSGCKDARLSFRSHFRDVCLRLSFLLCLAATAIQLAGVASLQNVCPLLPQVGRVSINELEGHLQTAASTLAQLRSDRPLTALPVLGEAIPPIMQALDILASATGTAVFTQTPEDCSQYFRYQWVTVSLQIFTLIVLVVALGAGAVSQARVALCALLILSSTMSIQCSHTFFYLGSIVSGTVYSRGLTFLIGCIMSIVANLFLVILLGTKEKGRGVKVQQTNSSSSSTQEPQDGVPLTASA